MRLEVSIMYLEMIRGEKEYNIDGVLNLRIKWCRDYICKLW